MIQSVNPAPTDETDGLPMPRRIWAVLNLEFMTVLLMSAMMIYPMEIKEQLQQILFFSRLLLTGR
mgnify:CR=1 FL=1